MLKLCLFQSLFTQISPSLGGFGPPKRLFPFILTLSILGIIYSPQNAKSLLISKLWLSKVQVLHNIRAICNKKTQKYASDNLIMLMNVKLIINILIYSCTILMQCRSSSAGLLVLLGFRSLTWFHRGPLKVTEHEEHFHVSQGIYKSTCSLLSSEFTLVDYEIIFAQVNYQARGKKNNHLAQRAFPASIRISIFLYKFLSLIASFVGKLSSKSI